MDEENRRIYFMWEKHVGVGIRWCTDTYMPYPLHISISLPFFSVEIGLGKLKTDKERGLFA